MSKCSKVSEKQLRDIRESFYLCSGTLKFAKHRDKNYVGQEVAKNQRTKRKIVWCSGKSWPVHRIVYYLSRGEWPKGVVDHIDGNPENNKPENLRDVSQSENTRSYGPAHKDSTSDFRGVHWFKRDRRWQAQIFCKGKKYHLGYFDCQKEAALMWNYSALELGFNKEAFNNVF